MERLVAGLLALALLAGCSAQIPFQGERSRDRIAQDLAIQPASIVNQQRCLISRYNGTPRARPLECIYIATSDYAAILDFDAKQGRFVEALRITRSGGDQVALVQGGPMNILKQMQVRQKTERYLVEFVNADFGQLGHHEDLLAAYQHLRSIGVAEADPLPYVTREVPPTPIVIPIYVPR